MITLHSFKCQQCVTVYLKDLCVVLSSLASYAGCRLSSLPNDQETVIEGQIQGKIKGEFEGQMIQGLR